MRESYSWQKVTVRLTGSKDKGTVEGIKEPRLVATAQTFRVTGLSHVEAKE